MNQENNSKYIVDIQKGVTLSKQSLGGKAFSLFELEREVDLAQLQIPNTLVLNSQAYSYFVRENKLENSINIYLKSIRGDDYNSIRKASHQIKSLIMNSDIPFDMANEIVAQVRENFGKKPIAIRSSSTLEDLTDRSYAGMYDSYLGISDKGQILEAVKKCYAGLFNTRALVYKLEKGESLDNLSMSVILQGMVNTNKSYSGVMFTYSKENSTDKIIVIDAAYGLGEGIVQNNVEPDEYIVFKPKIGDRFKPIIDKHLGSKKKMVIYEKGKTRLVPTTPKQRNSFVLDDEEVMALSKSAKKIEDYYKRPVDIEWAKDSNNGKLYILQARPITFKKDNEELILRHYQLGKTGEPIVTGLAIGDTIGQGAVKKIKSAYSAEGFSKGDILVAKMTSPDWLHLMIKASAIVTDEGGRTSHPAIISRELGKPCIVGAGNATSKLNNEQEVTVSCIEGNTGKVYDGRVSYKVTETKPNLPKTKTEILMNINLSDIAFRYATYPSDGVGMVREEFVIGDKIGIHPLALINYESLKKDPKNKKLVRTIEEKTKGYETPSEFYVQRLAQSLGKIAAAFYPREVIVKLTDFKSSEYRSVPGGDIYEPHEDNPLIGWRSAVRFYSKEYRPAFKLESEALRQVREVMGLDNIHPMIPFCRTPEEGQMVLDTLKEYGIPQGKGGMKVIAEVEVPTSIILMDQYAKLFDGFEIGSNCLTQSILCLDRNSRLTSHLFNENHPAMRAVIGEAIEKAHRYGKKIGIVGQAPSDIPEFTEFLIEKGIDSISLNPDPQTFIKMRQVIAEKEKSLTKK